MKSAPPNSQVGGLWPTWVRVGDKSELTNCLLGRPKKTICCDWTHKLGGVTRSDEKQALLKARIYFLEDLLLLQVDGLDLKELWLRPWALSPLVPGGDLKELFWLNSQTWKSILTETLDLVRLFLISPLKRVKTWSSWISLKELSSLERLCDWSFCSFIPGQGPRY